MPVPLRHMLTLAAAPSTSAPAISGAEAKSIHTTLQRACLLVVAIVGGVMLFASQSHAWETPTMSCATAIILTALCAILVQRSSAFSPAILLTTLGLLGLSLGALLGPPPWNRAFLLVVLLYAAVAALQSSRGGTAGILSALQIAVAMVLTAIGLVGDESSRGYAGIWLLLTFLPLAPFHLPFVTIVSTAKGALGSVWLVIFLSLGLAELHTLDTSLAQDMRVLVAGLALISALYASLKVLGQRQIRIGFAFAAVAQLALLWGLQLIFHDAMQWGVQYVLLIALVMAGLILLDTCLQHRFGSQLLGHIPGLAEPMPWLGRLLMLLMSVAVVLPIFPAVSGLAVAATGAAEPVSWALPFLTLGIVWFLGSWYFSHMIHHIACGQARGDVPYMDLDGPERSALILMIISAVCVVLVG